MTELRVAIKDGATNCLIAGAVAPGFEAVREAFSANFQEGLEVGASFAVFRGEELIVDLWGGHADGARSISIQHDTLFNLFSTTKGLTATCIALLVDQGKLSYEAPVAQYWPEFAQHGKQVVTVGQLMSHQAGICGPREVVTIQDYYAHDRVAMLLAGQKPYWHPGSAWGYHALAIGTLADELVRRVDGRTVGDFFATEVAVPLDLDAYLGLPEGDDHRQADVIRPIGMTLPVITAAPNPEAYQAAYENPKLDPEWPNSRRWRAAGLAGGGGSANARSLARLYGVLANGGEFATTRVLSPETIREATKERIAGFDMTSGEYKRYAAGFHLNQKNAMGPYTEAFGHDGWGGIMGFADPRQGLGVGYAMNQMMVGDWDGGDPRLARLLKATYAALERA